MISPMLLGELRLSWLPEHSVATWYAIIASCASVWLVLRLGWGRSLVRFNSALWLLRGVALAAAIAIALGPTLVDEIPGETSRASIVYLFDGSQSMQLGNEQTRWQQCLDFRAAAECQAGRNNAGDTRAFRFGHRLMPLGDEPATRSPESSAAAHPPAAQLTPGAEVTPVASATPQAAGSSIPLPDATDTRLADALRQLALQVDNKRSAGVVLLSDGRVRATESVERLAEHFGEAGVPIHVVPVGESVGSGDVAIVSMVAEPRVRKFTENQLTLFLRSFGFTGKRTVVRILSNSKIGEAGPTTLAQLPITLSGGAQSISLNFRVEDRPEDLTVVVDALDGELTARNNSIQTHIDIDRTKLRVLYIEGDVTAGSSLLSAFLSSGLILGARPASSALNVRDALQVDEDIECVVLVNGGDGRYRRVSAGYDGSSGLPSSRAEWFAYDCVVFSNVAPDVLEPEQAQQLASWIEGRGGGLVVTGTAALRKESWSSDHPLTPLLPIAVDSLEAGIDQRTAVVPTQRQHPVWRLRLEEGPNDALLGQLPPLSVGATGVVAKGNAEVVAETEEHQPVMVAARVGRGRVFLSTADLGGKSIEELGLNWGPQPERVASKLWRNIVYWATEGSSIGRRRLVAESDKRFYRPGETITIRATAYDESARKTDKVRVWAMFEPMSLDDPSLYSPALWPDDVIRESGESGPRVAWGEELPLVFNPVEEVYTARLMLSETAGSADSGMRIELTVYEGDESTIPGDHGTQVDSTSLAAHVLSDP
ncbi:MAG: hypothetical protein ACTHK7_15260, partial [Aureliella sp.]